jgi:hypothetical protein
MLVTRAMGRCTGQTDGATLRDNDAVCAGSVGGPDESPEIVRVFNAVEHNDKAVIGLAPFDQHVDIGVLFGARNCDDSLMGVGLGGAIELFASQEPDLDSAGAARVD